MADPRAGIDASLDVDTAGIRAAARPLPQLDYAAQDEGAAVVRTWHGAQPYYHAPEDTTLLAALDPVGPVVLRIGDRLSVAARALRTYADTAEPIIARLRVLLAAGPTAQLSTGLDAEIGRLRDELLAAEQACVLSLQIVGDNQSFTGVPGGIKVGEHTDKAGLALTVGVVKVGANNAFTITQNSDGSVSVTFVDTRELGATLGLGAGLTQGASTKVEVAPGFTVGLGDTWNFRKLSDAQAMLGQIQQYEFRQEQMRDPDSSFGALAADAVHPLDIRPPDVVAADGGASIKGTVKVGPGEPGLADPGANGSFAFTEKFGSTHDNTTGLTTTTNTVEGVLSGGASVTGRPDARAVGVGGQEAGTLAASTAVTRDAAGRVTRVVLTSTREGGLTVDENGGVDVPGSGGGKVVHSDTFARSTTTTTVLNVTDRDRDTVQQWLASHGSDADEVVTSPKTFRPDQAVSGDAFQQLLHADATVTEVEYEKHTQKPVSIDAKAEAGPGVGIEASVEGTDVRATRAHYLARPGRDGERHAVDLPVTVKGS